MNLLLKSAAMLIAAATTVSAATYYVDFDAGQDTADGKTPATAVKYAPGDDAAKHSIKLEAGDTVVFKGGVAYRGTIKPTASGAEGKPIVFDGNTAGDFGSGRAIVEGSEPVGSWKRFASADEAQGNPNWEKLLYTEAVPAKADPLTVHLLQGDRLMHVAQWPAPPDLFWWDNLTTARVMPSLPESHADVLVTPSKGLKSIGYYAWDNLIDGSKAPVYLNPADGAELTVTLKQPVTAERFVFRYGADDARITQITLLGDGKEILSQKISAEDNADKKGVTLRPSAAATFTTLTIRVDSHEGGEKKLPSVRISEFEAFNAAGQNLLQGAKARNSLTDPEFLNQADANAWTGAYVAILGKPMKFYFEKVNAFHPDQHRIDFDRIAADWYKVGMGKYAMFNALPTLQQPGQYVLWRGVDGKAKPRLIAWPLDGGSFEREARIAARADGFVLAGSHLTVRGFAIQHQAGKVSAIRSSGQTHHVTIENNVIRGLRSALDDRSATISLKECDDFVISRNEIHDNVRCIGVMVSKSERGVFAGNNIRRNGDTQVDFYTCRDFKVTGNTISESNGHHGNGLTFYVGNQNVLVENNTLTCLRPMTFHTIDGMTIRNNVMNSQLGGNCISIWQGGASNKVTIEHNTLVNAKPNSYEAGIYRGDTKGTGVAIRNNIIDGLGGEWANGATLENNVFLRTGEGITSEKLGPSNRVAQPEELFVDPAKGDYRVKPDVKAGAQ